MRPDVRTTRTDSNVFGNRTVFGTANSFGNKNKFQVRLHSCDNVLCGELLCAGDWSCLWEASLHGRG